MESNQSTTSEILKQESVGYLKSKLNLLQGTLFMTADKIVLDAHKSGAGGFGVMGSLLKNKVEKQNVIFDLDRNSIKSVVHGKHGVQNNVLEITDKNNNTFRIIVKNYKEWEDAIKQKQYYILSKE
jgi:hypothetical protein